MPVAAARRCSSMPASSSSAVCSCVLESPGRKAGAFFLKKTAPCEPTHGAAVAAAVSATPPLDLSEFSSFCPPYLSQRCILSPPCSPDTEQRASRMPIVLSLSFLVQLLAWQGGCGKAQYQTCSRSLSSTLSSLSERIAQSAEGSAARLDACQRSHPAQPASRCCII